MLENIKRKISYILLLMTLVCAYVIALVYSFIYRKKNEPNITIKKIAAVWYNPPDLTGSNLRMGHWKTFFEEQGYEYDNYYIGSIKEFIKWDNSNWADYYKYQRLYLYRRLKQFLLLKNYEVVWIDRSFVIGYPLKKAFFERCLKRMVNYLVVDTTDGGDYELTPELIMDTMRQADRITVGFEYLKEFYSQNFNDVVQFNWTIPEDNYIIKNQYEINDLPIIGWMGSPGNFVHVKQIEEQLKKVAQIIPFKFVYICREKQDINIPGAVIEHHEYGDDYFNIISSFDIGIAPCFGDSITFKGKIAMKHQEYLLCAIPQVCSPVAISEYVKDEEDVLIASEIDSWKPQLIRVLEDVNLRERIAKNSRNVFLKHYTFASEFPKVLDALVKFN